jgi:very-short-patch-repair endonuclease
MKSPPERLLFKMNVTDVGSGGPASEGLMRPSPHRLQILEQRAAQMRGAPTSSEARLFEALRGGRLGVSFRRQVPLVGRFIADFYAPTLKLVVEVDGGYHEARRCADARRDRALERAGSTCCGSTATRSCEICTLPSGACARRSRGFAAVGDARPGTMLSPIRTECSQ